MSWVTVCKLQDIPVLGARRVQRAQGMDVALFRNEAGDVFALLDRCPHKGGPLSQGIVTEQGVACPLHNWTIDLRTGQAAAPDEGQAPVFQVQREGDTVLLNAHELATLATDLQPPRAGPCTRAHIIPIAVA